MRSKLHQYNILDCKHLAIHYCFCRVELSNRNALDISCFKNGIFPSYSSEEDKSLPGKIVFGKSFLKSGLDITGYTSNGLACDQPNRIWREHVFTRSMENLIRLKHVRQHRDDIQDNPQTCGEKFTIFENYNRFLEITSSYVSHRAKDGKTPVLLRCWLKSCMKKNSSHIDIPSWFDLIPVDVLRLPEQIYAN